MLGSGYTVQKLLAVDFLSLEEPTSSSHSSVGLVQQGKAGKERTRRHDDDTQEKGLIALQFQ